MRPGGHLLRNWTDTRSVDTILNALDDDMSWLRGWGFLYIPDAGKSKQVTAEVQERFPRGVVVVNAHEIEVAGGRDAVEGLAARLRVLWENHERWEGKMFASVLWIGSMNPGEPAPGIPTPAAAGLIRVVEGPPW